eukprot:g7277.t1
MGLKLFPDRALGRTRVRRSPPPRWAPSNSNHRQGQRELELKILRRGRTVERTQKRKKQMKLTYKAVTMDLYNQCLWIHHVNYDLVWTNGAGILIVDKELRRQVRKLHAEGKEAELARAVRWRPRMLALYLDEIVIAAAYSPTRDQTAAAEEFDRGLLELMTEMKRRKQDKWKFRVCLGDFNAQVGADEFGGMSVHGGWGMQKSTARGRKLARRLNEQNFVLAGSHFEAAGGDYTTFSSALGSSEVGHAIVPGGCLPKCRGYERVDLNVGCPHDPAGQAWLNSKRYAHKALELSIEIRTKKQLVEEGKEKKLRGMQVATALPRETIQWLNGDLQRKIEANRGSFGLGGLQQHLIDVLPSMLVPKSSIKIPKKLSKNPPRLAEDASCRAKMWQIFSESESLMGGRVSCAITAEQATKQYEAVGSNPLHAGEERLPIESEMPGLLDPLPSDLVEKLDAPIGFKEFKAAAGRSWQGGQAVDVHGLSGGVLRFLDDASLRLLLVEINKEMEEKTLADLGKELHLCKDSALFKGKGDKRDPDGYRFLVISPVILKLMVRIYSDRLYSLLEDSSFFDASQYGFRRGRGCLESLLTYGRLKEDMLHHRCDELHSMTAVLIDLRKAFPGTDWRLMRATVDAMGLGGTRDSADQVHRVHDLLFADDTTILTQLSQRLAKEVTAEALEAKAAKPKRAPMELPVMSLMLATLDDAGMRENETKREQGDVTLLDVRNLGAQTSPVSDIRVKTAKAWAAFHRLKRLVSGVAKLSSSRKGELIVVMVRPRWEGLVSDKEMRRRAQIPPLMARLKFLQARFLAHTLRRERNELSRIALTGHFFPDPASADAGIATYLVSATDNTQIEPKARKVPDVLASFHRHMSDCGMPPELLPILSRSLGQLNDEHGTQKGGEEYNRNKRVMHALTRKRLILDTVEDWSRGNLEEDEGIADKLTMRYFGDKKKEMTRWQLREEAVLMGWDLDTVELSFSNPGLGAESFLRGDKCGVCGDVIRAVGGAISDLKCDPVDELRPSDELRTHLKTQHSLRAPDVDSDTRLQMEAEARDKLKGWENRFRDAALSRCGEAVREIRQRGQPRVGRNAGAPLLQCLRCGVKFSTTAGAMELHQAAHGRDDYIWLYQVKGPYYRASDPEPDLKDKYRPEQHCYDATNGRYHGGSDAVCVRVTPPADAMDHKDTCGTRPTSIKCRQKEQVEGPGED